MGYNTQILVLNDGWDQAKKHPEHFVEAVDFYVQGRTYGRPGPVGHHANMVSGLRTAHADQHRIIVSHGNLMSEMSKYNAETMELATRNEFGKKEILGRITQARWYLDQLEKEILA